GGRDWEIRADIQSVACLVYAIIHSFNFLFDPHGRRLAQRKKNEDNHMAQIIELLGDLSVD
ncbi:hypothetical protein B0H12DRAFT_962348, partial [Mycena haematopus]